MFKLGVALCYLAILTPLAVALSSGPIWAMFVVPAVLFGVGFGLMKSDQIDWFPNETKHLDALIDRAERIIEQADLVRAGRWDLRPAEREEIERLRLELAQVTDEIAAWEAEHRG